MKTNFLIDLLKELDKRYTYITHAQPEGVWRLDDVGYERMAGLIREMDSPFISMLTTGGAFYQVTIHLKEKDQGWDVKVITSAPSEELRIDNIIGRLKETHQ